MRSSLWQRQFADDERVKETLEKISIQKTFSRKRKGTGHGGTIK